MNDIIGNYGNQFLIAEHVIDGDNTKVIGGVAYRISSKKTHETRTCFKPSNTFEITSLRYL